MLNFIYRLSRRWETKNQKRIMMNLKSRLRTALIPKRTKSNLNAKSALVPSTHLMFPYPKPKLANPLVYMTSNFFALLACDQEGRELNWSCRFWWTMKRSRWNCLKVSSKVIYKWIYLFMFRSYHHSILSREYLKSGNWAFYFWSWPKAHFKRVVLL